MTQTAQTHHTTTQLGADGIATLTQPGAEVFITRLKGLCEAARSFPATVIGRLSGYTLAAGLKRRQRVTCASSARRRQL